jgi:hypothetical protein
VTISRYISFSPILFKLSYVLQKYKGLLRGPLVVQCFACHFTAISGSRWISGLSNGSNESTSAPLPRPSLALAAAAVCIYFIIIICDSLVT